VRVAGTGCHGSRGCRSRTHHRAGTAARALSNSLP
jgi:hypothetical protein